ncbi:hypothetical protein EMN47_18730 [Prolixibacteraceae bacterium JC049]|nr:hypothetical protein [Prolixibacteraceae bacterium JC049]
MLSRYFNPKRFARLYRHDMLMNYKMYGMFLLAISIIIFGALFFIMLDRYHNFGLNRYMPFLIMTIIFGGILSITTAFPMTKNKVSLTSFLMQPASIFEKFMVQFLNRIVFFFPLLLIIFWIDAHLAQGIVSMFEFPRDVNIADFSYGEVWNTRDFVKAREEALWLLIGMFWTIVSFAFMGSTIFNRYKLFKVLIFFGLVVFVGVCYSVVLSHIFLPGRTTGFEVEMISYKIYGETYNVELFAYLFASLSSLFLLPLAFYKLKEKEV